MRVTQLVKDRVVFNLKQSFTESPGGLIHPYPISGHLWHFCIYFFKCSDPSAPRTRFSCPDKFGYISQTLILPPFPMYLPTLCFSYHIGRTAIELFTPNQEGPTGPLLDKKLTILSIIFSKKKKRRRRRKKPASLLLQITNSISLNAFLEVK